MWPTFHLDANAFRASVRNAAPADVLRHFYRAYAQRHGKQRWGDKWPENGINIARIGELLPEARFIHIIRDGRDVAASLRETWFRPGETFEACMELWGFMVREGQRQACAVPGRYIEVRYERLVREPRAVLHELSAFIGLRYDEAMLRYHERARERHAEIGDVVRGGRCYDKNEIASLMHTDRPPFVTSIGSWRTAMSPAEAAACERVAGSLLADLGYAR